MPTFSEFSCMRKIRHSSQKKAQATIDRIKRSKQRISKSLVAYKCVICDGWHTGNKKKRG